MVKLIEEPFSNFYFANFLSKASCVCLLFSFTAILAPFYLAFTTDNFWLNMKQGFEHPKVTFIAANIFPIGTDSFSKVNVYPIWKDKTTGTLNVDRVDEFQVDMTVTLAAAKKDLQIALEFEYELTDVTQMKMRGLSFLSFQSQYSYDAVKFYGYLTLKQQAAFFAGGNDLKQFNITSYPTGLDYTTALTQQARFTNSSLDFEYQYFTYYASTAPTTVTISGKIHIPRYQEITYIPSFSETLKFAWAAYFSIFIVLVYICRGLLKRIYRYSIFSVSVKDNLPETVFLNSKLKQD